MHQIMPEIILIAAVDEDLNTVYQGKPISFHPDVSRDSRLVDQAFLRQALEKPVVDLDSPDPTPRQAVVMGETCWDEVMSVAPMYKKALMANMDTAFISGPENVLHLSEPRRQKLISTHEFSDVQDKAERVRAMRNFVLASCIDCEIDRLFVLGGQSVYNAFAPIANEVYLTMFPGLLGGEKPIEVGYWNKNSQVRDYGDFALINCMHSPNIDFFDGAGTNLFEEEAYKPGLQARGIWTTWTTSTVEETRR